MKKYTLLTLTVLFASMFFLPSIVTVAENGDNSEQPTNDSGTYFDAENLRYYVLTGALNVTVAPHPNHLEDNTYEIPSTVENEGVSYKVIGIYGGGFYACKNITKITVPISIESIPENAFNEQIKFAQTDGTTEIDKKNYSQLLPGSTYLGENYNLVRQPITVSFDYNGGVAGIDSISVGHNEQYGELPSTTREGYTFTGWFTEREGGVQITPETICGQTEDCTLYAHWNGNVCKLTFDPNGGNVDPSSMDVVYGSAYGALPTPTRDGYSFSGWFTDNGDRVDENTICTGDCTLHAYWEAVPVGSSDSTMTVLVCTMLAIISFVLIVAYGFYRKA